MDFLTLAKSRFSVRSFSARPIEPEKLQAILEAGQVSPTACNLQPQRILVIQSEAALEKYRRCTVCHFNAPLAILTCYDKSADWTREYDGKSSGDIDAAIVTTHMMLEAAAQGIGSTWVMHFIPEAVREEFHLPDTWVPVSLLALGYPAEDATPYPDHSSIKPLAETVTCL